MSDALPQPMSRQASCVSFALDSSQLADQYDALSDHQFGNGKRLAAELGIRSGQRILDVGAGTGRLAEHLAGLAGSRRAIAAIDPLPHRIALAHQRLGLTTGDRDTPCAVPKWGVDRSALISHS